MERLLLFDFSFNNQMEFLKLFSPFLEKGEQKSQSPEPAALAAPFPDGLCRAHPPE